MQNLNINFTQQHKFKDCIYKKQLKFDFALHLNKLGLIEFQGRQHFEAVDQFGGEKTFKEQQLRDSIKKNYCEINNIPILYIRYDQTKEIPKLIKNFLEQLSQELIYSL